MVLAGRPTIWPPVTRACTAGLGRGGRWVTLRPWATSCGTGAILDLLAHRTGDARRARASNSTSPRRPGCSLCCRRPRLQGLPVRRHLAPRRSGHRCAAVSALGAARASSRSRQLHVDRRGGPTTVFGTWPEAGTRRPSMGAAIGPAASRPNTPSCSPRLSHSCPLRRRGRRGRVWAWPGLSPRNPGTDDLVAQAAPTQIAAQLYITVRTVSSTGPDLGQITASRRPHSPRTRRHCVDLERRPAVDSTSCRDPGRMANLACCRARISRCRTDEDALDDDIPTPAGTTRPGGFEAGETSLAAGALSATSAPTRSACWWSGAAVAAGLIAAAARAAVAVRTLAMRLSRSARRSRGRPAATGQPAAGWTQPGADLASSTWPAGLDAARTS